MSCVFGINSGGDDVHGGEVHSYHGYDGYLLIKIITCTKLTHVFELNKYLWTLAPPAIIMVKVQWPLK